MKLKISTVSYSLYLLILISCSKDYYTLEDFYTLNKIDTHLHINSNNSALADLATKDNFKLLAVNVDVPGFPSLERQKGFAITQKKQSNNQVEFLTSFTLSNWDSADWVSQRIASLKLDFKDGALGIKIWKNVGMTYKDSTNHFIMIDNPKFDSVIEYVISQNKTVMGHLGEPRNCWLPIEQMTVNNDKEYFKEHPEYHMYLHPEYPTYEEQINARDRFLERHPNMRFVGAHLGSLEWSVDELSKRLDKFPNMAVDLAERISHLQYQSKIDREKIREFIIKYQDRLIYATDGSMDSLSNPVNVKEKQHAIWILDWKYFSTNEKMTVKEIDGEFYGLQLPKEVIDKIYHHNAMKWFNIK